MEVLRDGLTIKERLAKAHPDKDFRLMVKEAYDYALRDLPRFSKDMISGAVGSYFSDHFTRQLKADLKYKDIIILALTAYAMKGDDEKAREAGCDGYVTKPIDVQAFPGLVRRYLSPWGRLTD